MTSQNLKTETVKAEMLKSVLFCDELLACPLEKDRQDEAKPEDPDCQGWSAFRPFLDRVGSRGFPVSVKPGDRSEWHVDEQIGLNGKV